MVVLTVRPRDKIGVQPSERVSQQSEQRADSCQPHQNTNTHTISLNSTGETPNMVRGSEEVRGLMILSQFLTHPLMFNYIAIHGKETI